MSKFKICTKIDFICFLQGQKALYANNLSLPRGRVCAKFRFAHL